MWWERDKISYLAGLFDGEGCVYIAVGTGGRGGKHQYRALRMVISNTNTDVMNWLKSEFGGSFYAKGRPENGHKQAYNWFISRDKAKQLLMLIYPHCIIKKKDIESKLKLVR